VLLDNSSAVDSARSMVEQTLLEIAVKTSAIRVSWKIESKR
jgi:hypothetical protein